MATRYNTHRLREIYPEFEYTRFEWDSAGSDLVCRFYYRAAALSNDEGLGELTFTHTLTFKDSATQALELDPLLLERWIFHLGLVELYNYWKATCSPHIHISAGELEDSQLSFWHDLLINGLGEYFFVNNIDFTHPDFVTLNATEPSAVVPQITPTKLTQDSVLVPVGGGKDSAVVLRLLSQQSVLTVETLTLNPIPASLRIIDAVGISHNRVITRKIDPLLIQLNTQGYLNGHVPFSAILSFLSTFTALLYSRKYVVLSNERSSNEGNIEFNSQTINHQYSKTFDYEEKFTKYLAAEPILSATELPQYFSLLRPLYELQIGKLFAQDPALLPLFRSCNRGHKTDTWCNKCSKCLFAFAILSPFIPLPELSQAFGSNLFADESLLETALELIGAKKHKPLECVGTYQESLVAFSLAARLYSDQKLLMLLHAHLLSKESLTKEADTILTSWNTQNLLPPVYALILHETLERTNEK